MNIIVTAFVAVLVILFLCVSIFLIRKLPYKQPLMKIKDQGCYNCKWAKEKTYSYEVFQKCNCPVISNLDSNTGEYNSLCLYNIGISACKWKEK